MHVGLLTADLHHGHGWGHYGLSLARALVRQGVQVTILAAANSPSPDGLSVIPCLPPISPAVRGILPRMAALTPRTRDLLRGVDLIHCTAEPYAPLAWWTSVTAGKPFIITGHGTYAQAGVFHAAPVRAIHQAAFRAAQAVICVSGYTAQVAAAYTPHIHTVTIPNGVDPARFANLPIPNPPVTRPTILSAGGVKARKGTLELVRAVARVRAVIPDVQAVIVGSLTAEPRYVVRVQAEIAALGLTEQVRLTGFIPEPELMAYYAAADVFAVPSMNDGLKFEGFGLTNLEASAAGLPVIATHGNGTGEAVLDGITGYLVHQGRVVDELSAALVHLLQHPDAARQMGDAGRQRAQSMTWDAVASQVMGVYIQKQEKQ
ncbi:MAG: glycosyltransferase family 4 protein [Phototrophicaceae bacterium]